MHVSAIIAAGGSGTRLAAGMPKQFVSVGGQTMLERSLSAFGAHARITEVILALPPDTKAEGDIGQHVGKLRVVIGGTRRQDSVANAFDAVSSQAEIVLVHDAARPFVSADVISRSIDAAAEYGAAITALPVTDTV